MLQAVLNNECIDKMPLVKKYMEQTVSRHSRNQIRVIALHKAMNSLVSINSMTPIELKSFQIELIKEFNFRGL